MGWEWEYSPYNSRPYRVLIILRNSVQGSHSGWKNMRAFSSQGKGSEFLSAWKSQGILPKMLEKYAKLLNYYIANIRKNENVSLLYVQNVIFILALLSIPILTFKDLSIVPINNGLPAKFFCLFLWLCINVLRDIGECCESVPLDRTGSYFSISINITKILACVVQVDAFIISL